MDTNIEIQTDLAEVPAPEPNPPFDYRGNGKVARLPRNIRDQTNQWLLDGLSYPEVIERRAIILQVDEILGIGGGGK